MTQVYIRFPFAVSGDQTAIPVTDAADGPVSFTYGYGLDYSRDRATDPAARVIERDEFNYLMYVNTVNIQQLQQYGAPLFIAAADNGGSAFGYAQYAEALYDPGSGLKRYQSKTAANTELPSNTTFWQLVSGQQPFLNATNAWAGTNSFLDGSLSILNTADNTKIAKFSAASITAGQTRTYILPDANTTLVGTDVTQTLTGKTMSGSSNTFTNISLTTAVTGVLPAANGGTGQSSYAVGDILYASGAAALSPLAGVATGNALISGGVATAPSWGKIGLTTHISGTLAVGNGGTGVATLTGLVKGTGTAAFSAAVQGTDYYAPGGTDVAVADGGTNISSYAIGDLLQASGTGTLAKLAAVATGNVLISGGVTTVSSWGKVGLTTHVSGILPGANGGTNNGFMAFSGPATSLKTYTLPNASATILTDNAAVTAAQGGTGQAGGYAIGDILYASSATALSKLADVATGNVLLSGGVTTAPLWGKVGLTTHVSGILAGTNGGTGVNNGSNTITLAGNLVTSGAFSITLTAVGTTNITLPTSGTLMSSADFTDWTSYVPTTNGLGIPTITSAYYKKNFGSLEIMVRLTVGITTAAEARIGLPFTTSATKIPTLGFAGSVAYSAAASIAYLMLMEPSVAYLTMGAQNASLAGLVKRNGNDLFSSGQSISFYAVVPL